MAGSYTVVLQQYPLLTRAPLVCPRIFLPAAATDHYPDHHGIYQINYPTSHRAASVNPPDAGSGKTHPRWTPTAASMNLKNLAKTLGISETTVRPLHPMAGSFIVVIQQSSFCAGAFGLARVFFCARPCNGSLITRAIIR